MKLDQSSEKSGSFVRKKILKAVTDIDTSFPVVGDKPVFCSNFIAIFSLFFSPNR